MMSEYTSNPISPNAILWLLFFLVAVVQKTCPRNGPNKAGSLFWLGSPVVEVCSQWPLLKKVLLERSPNILLGTHDPADATSNDLFIGEGIAGSKV